MPHPRKTYSEETRAAIRRAIAEGKSSREICRTFNVFHRQLQRDFDLPPNRTRLFSPAEAKEIRIQVASGKSQRAVARERGSHSAVISRLVRFETYKDVR